MSVVPGNLVLKIMCHCRKTNINMFINTCIIYCLLILNMKLSYLLINSFVPATTAPTGAPIPCQLINARIRKFRQKNLS